MKSCSPLGALFGGLAFGLVLAVYVPGAHANVYATNIKINGGMTNLTVAPGTSLAISYILNEPASAGVTVQILSGTTPVRTLSLAAGAPGTLRGLNTNVVWDAKDDHGQDVPLGNYTVSITAASTGYPRWTPITTDTNPGNYAWESRGIAVDKNPRSPFYGRIFVGNSIDNTGNNPSPLPGDSVGILKLNADASYADEGGFETGGVTWTSGMYAPWKIRISQDDLVYVGAFHERGNNGGNNADDIYRFDPTISSNSMLRVFAPPADTSLGEWTGFCVTGAGGNTLLWGADDRNAGSLGIRSFAVKTDGTFDPSAGAPVVGVGNTADLNVGPFAVAVDARGAIYTLQQRDTQGDGLARVFRFPAYDSSTNNGLAETKADWSAGGNDSFCGARGLAVDPTGTYVAACFWGYSDLFLGGYLNGNIKLLYATNGALVADLDLGLAFPTTPNSDPHHMDTDCDWDAVGNLYYLDDWLPCWRAFSPPGPNQATTVALPVVQVSTLPAPTITSISFSNDLVVILFTAGANEPASAFGLLSASNVYGPYTLVPSAVITGSGGNFRATVTTNAAAQYYDVQRLSTTTQAPQIQQLGFAAGKAVITFTGAASDSASAFTLLSSSTANGTYTPAAGATVTGSGGTFQATVPTNGPTQFFRIRR